MNPSSQPSILYSAPTTDTLGDESTALRTFAVQAPAQSRPHLTTANNRVNSTVTPVGPAPSAALKRRRRKRPKAGTVFQYVEDWPYVTIQVVHLAQRSAFHTTPIPNGIEYDPANVNHNKRLSPSPLHMQVLQQVHRLKVLRQIKFSNGVSDLCQLEPPSETNPPSRRDGRYRAVHPLRIGLDPLPQVAPLPSHKKTRLPIRADVGFPGSSKEEMDLKQVEIRNETAWEEASPRIALLTTSEDLGTTVVDDGLKYAGRSLRLALHANAQHFGRPSVMDPTTTPTTSILSPPIDCLYSASLGWRPRPIHDRPPGWKYFIACLTKISVDRPMVGSLAIFADNQKLSEDFHFPCGPWETDLFRHVELCHANGSINTELARSWLQLPKKGIFAYESKVQLVVRMSNWMDGVISPALFGVAAVPLGQAWPSGTHVTVDLHSDEEAALSDRPWTAGKDGCDDDTEGENVIVSKKRGGVVGRLFRTPARPTKSRTASAQSEIPPAKEKVAECTLFISSLGTDFVQALLSHPVELPTSSPLPRVMVDFSGDLAVAVESSAQVLKRSSLLRLPPCDSPAGYTNSAEFREVMPLSARKQHSWDTWHAHGRVLPNILFLYPRVALKRGFTILFTVHQGDKPLHLFHSPAPWVDGALIHQAVISDELKIRLPQILDGSLALQIEMLHCGEVKETSSIPISTLVSGPTGRVATTIPNGTHRIRLGEHHLVLETRLISGFHVGDPAVACALRDFPLSNVASGSESAVVGHFHTLVFLHLQNLVRQTQTDSLQTIIRNLFVVLSKVKSHVGVTNFFFKAFLDEFDEAALSELFQDEAVSFEFEHNVSYDEIEDSQDLTTSENDVGSKRRISFRDRRVSRIVQFSQRIDVPFSRTAYVATKAERMRVEAELYYDHGTTGQLFEDDETVVTATSFYTSATKSDRGGSHREAINNDASPGIIFNSNPYASERTTEKWSTHAEFANRMKTVAQVMLAPCVGPSISGILSGRSSPRKMQSDINADEDVKRAHAMNQKSFRSFKSPGSDLDEGPSEAGIPSHGQKIMRGPIDAPTLVFSVKFEHDNEVPIGCGNYLYESIMLLWLRAWLDHVERRLRDPDTGKAGPVATFPVYDFDSRELEVPTVLFFYSHMDFLLPLCLKSIVLRYSVEVLPTFPIATKVLLDSSHVMILEPFVELLARGLMGKALSGLGSPSRRETSVANVLSSASIIMDFFVGLISVVHPQHMSALLTKYFYTLRDCETEHLGLSRDEFQWTEESLHRVRCSRHLRIHAVEVLSSLPSFLALNFPIRFSGKVRSKKSSKASWLQQYSDFNSDSPLRDGSEPYEDGLERLPRSGWLAELVVTEGMSVCSLSCEAVVAEAMAQIEVSRHDTCASKSLKNRPGAALTRDDMLMFQSLAVHAITVVYELVIRRHSMDSRFQTESARGRVASLFAPSILEMSISSVRWLSRLESTHKIRSLWLLCFVYVLQESPDVLVCEFVRSCCNPEDMRIHRYIRLLRLCSSTFQGFVDLPRYSRFPSETGRIIAPWLLQESFNTICAATITVVEECAAVTSSYPQDQEKMTSGLLDLLLHMLTTPQSSVTHLRAVGGAIHALEKFGVAFFVQVIGDNLQNWIRVMLSLMNSTSLSVRSIAVDFVISLLGALFDEEGSIHDLTLIFVTVLPEVAAREIGMHSVAGLFCGSSDVHKTIWPLRRSFADLADANPLDDDRVDSELLPALSTFCRACQAVLDGVLIELRLKTSRIVETPLNWGDIDVTFDADEESLCEVANFFLPETAPLQRLRWLSTLQILHTSKDQFVEAAEALFLCAMTVADAIPHFESIWRPAPFILWSDPRRSLWLESVGEEMGLPHRGNAQVMDFAENFLDPLGQSISVSPEEHQTIRLLCRKLVEYTKEAVNLYLKVKGMEEIAFSRLEALQRRLNFTIDDFATRNSRRGESYSLINETELRNASAKICFDMTKLAEVLMLSDDQLSPLFMSPSIRISNQRFALMRFSGKMPSRFRESTSLPTFFDWDTPCIYRITMCGGGTSAQDWLQHFARPFIKALQELCECVLLYVDKNSTEPVPENATVVYLNSLEPVDPGPIAASTSPFVKRFISRTKTALIEMTISQPFPCALSRQRIIFQKETHLANHKN